MSKIIANWKMYLTIEESRHLAAKLAEWWKTGDCVGVDFVVCPSALAVQDVASYLLGAGIQLGSQSVSLSNSLGAFTGQIAAQQIKELGMTHVLIGHSEMRQFYGVTDIQAAQSMQVALANGLTPVICIGETADERQAGLTDHVIISQLHTIFAQVPQDPCPIAIAYEPRWAIGSGKPVEPKEAERVHNLIRHTLKEFFQEDQMEYLQVLYGGSVTSDNVQQFLRQPNVDGALVGSASAKLETLQSLIQTIKQTIC